MVDIQKRLPGGNNTVMWGVCRRTGTPTSAASVAALGSWWSVMASACDPSTSSACQQRNALLQMTRLKPPGMELKELILQLRECCKWICVFVKSIAQIHTELLSPKKPVGVMMLIVQVLLGLPDRDWRLRYLQEDGYCWARHIQVQDGQLRLLLPLPVPQQSAGPQML